MVKECLFGTSSTPGKVGIGNLSVLFLSNPRPDKCENLMETKPRNEIGIWNEGYPR